jgi:PhnB protein
MKGINAYLIFDGNCRQAMQFYAKNLGAKLDVMPFSAAPCPEGQPAPPIPAEAKDRVMHARLVAGPVELMASDNMPGMPFVQGNNFWVSLQCDSVPEIEKLYNAFSEKAKIVQPLQKTFWAERFGMLTDQFGVNWMFNLYAPQAQQ